MSVSEESARTPSRRTVVAAVGTAGLAAALVACGGSDDSGTKGQKPSPGEALAKTSEIPVGGGKIFADAGVVVTQPEQGEFKAFSNICTHRQCPVASVGDGTINCVCHGSRFSIEDGSVKHLPATQPLPAKKIAVKGDEITLS